MPRLSTKPDASFFRKIVIGAVGARAVAEDLATFGHQFEELERGATGARLWRDVKRKRVRIPDLLCVRCGVRVECRAKTEPGLSMSHSPTDAERAWDFGMIDADWVAFPVCEPVQESDWTNGKLREGTSYWREKRWAQWRASGRINYFTVEAFRSQLHARSRTKGVEEGSENFIGWEAVFSTRNGRVLAVDHAQGRVTVALADGSRPCTWRPKPGTRIVVAPGETVDVNQVIASAVPPIPPHGLHCPASLHPKHIEKLLGSRERTQRFTGMKLARLRKEAQFEAEAQDLAQDEEEDVYVRLEAASYLATCCARSAAAVFEPYLTSADPQTQLEAAIALGEAGTTEATEVLSSLLDDAEKPFFLRSAAAWALGQIGSERASSRLVGAFSNVEIALRFDALESLVAIGGPAWQVLLEGLHAADEHTLAGCAEALRRQPSLPPEIVSALIQDVQSPRPSRWIAWLIGHLPPDRFAAAVAPLQHTKPELHYAITLLWSFVGSWIARNWEIAAALDLPFESGKRR